MTTRAITNFRSYCNVGKAGERGTAPKPLVIADGRFVEEGQPNNEASAAEHLDAAGRIFAPGLIDTHVHGGGSFDLMTDDPEQVRGYARWAASRGVTGFLISTSGRDHTQIVHRLRALAPLIAEPGPGAARVLGFHLEGPYINPVRKGAFDPRWLRAPSVAEYEELFEASGGAIRQMTLAPELPCADELIGAVVASGAVAAMGHTDATYEQAMRAIDLGVTHVTHCFNAMRPFSHRDPGVLGAVLTTDTVTAELIGDGAHVDYAAARVLIRAKGPGRIVLITDGMPLAGTDDGEGEWEGVRIRVDGGKAVRVSDGTIIGGVITLADAVQNAARYMEVGAAEAIDMASVNASAALKLRDGAGWQGKNADFILLDDELRVTETWVAGERVWTAAGAA
ncbi:MAG: N-acetylglucosamine-6-phosphate deacetylase [Chloroflexota bacterium]|nr:N-acetylglucosamine-6-phosphate deacetylase [Chloroflexota bacterium]